MQPSTQTFLEVPIRHESEFGKVLDLEGQQAYLITHDGSDTVDILNYHTPLPEFVFDSYFSMADTTDYRVQTGDDMHYAVEIGHTHTVTSLQIPVPDSTEPSGGFHKPVLDIDFPAALLPSSTEGHYHLYLDKEVIWDDYVALLKALATCGIIEQGYANASIERGHTAVRLPWVKKPVLTGTIDASRFKSGTIEHTFLTASDESSAEPFPVADAIPGKVKINRPTIAERRAAKARQNLDPAPEPYYPNPTYSTKDN